jgi:hypothetical protein
MITEVMPYRGPSYLALRFAAMRKKRSFTIPELMHVFGHKYKKPYMAGRSLERLVSYKFLERYGDTWQITAKGHEYLRMTGENYMGEKSER